MGSVVKNVRRVAILILLVGIWFSLENAIAFVKGDSMNFLERLIQMVGATAYLGSGIGLMWSAQWAIWVFIGIVPYVLAHYLIMWVILINRYSNPSGIFSPPAELLGILLMIGAVLGPLWIVWYLARSEVVFQYMPNVKHSNVHRSPATSYIMLYTLWVLSSVAFFYTRCIKDAVSPKLALGALACSVLLVRVLYGLNRNRGGIVMVPGSTGNKVKDGS